MGKVKSAIILAAGRGKRLNELTETTPKPLLKVKDEVLIERLIQQFKRKGIDEIYVVTGYKYWEFYYLQDKFDVTLVYNKKWFCTNNIISFIKGYEGRSRICNESATIMCDADIYIENEDIIEQTFNFSGYYLEHCTNKDILKNEWTVNIDEDNWITDVETSSDINDGYVLRSFSYWMPEALDKLYRQAKELTKDGQNMQLYIDNIPCLINKREYPLLGRVYKTPALLEVDNLIDYENANKE